jgi:hypothetical protein
MNFGMRALSEKIDPDPLVEEISRYDAADATEVSQKIRASSDIESTVDDAVSLYREVIEEFRQTEPVHAVDDSRAVAEYLRWMSLQVRQRETAYEHILANALPLRLRNQLGRLPLMERVFRSIARRSRRNGAAHD